MPKVIVGRGSDMKYHLGLSRVCGDGMGGARAPDGCRTALDLRLKSLDLSQRQQEANRVFKWA